MIFTSLLLRHYAIIAINTSFRHCCYTLRYCCWYWYITLFNIVTIFDYYATCRIDDSSAIILLRDADTPLPLRRCHFRWYYAALWYIRLRRQMSGLLLRHDGCLLFDYADITPYAMPPTYYADDIADAMPVICRFYAIAGVTPCQSAAIASCHAYCIRHTMSRWAITLIYIRLRRDIIDYADILMPTFDCLPPLRHMMPLRRHDAIFADAFDATPFSSYWWCFSLRRDAISICHIAIDADTLITPLFTLLSLAPYAPCASAIIIEDTPMLVDADAYYYDERWFLAVGVFAADTLSPLTPCRLSRRHYAATADDAITLFSPHTFIRYWLWWLIISLLISLPRFISHHYDYAVLIALSHYWLSLMPYADYWSFLIFFIRRFIRRYYWLISLIFPHYALLTLVSSYLFSCHCRHWCLLTLLLRCLFFFIFAITVIALFSYYGAIFLMPFCADAYDAAYFFHFSPAAMITIIGYYRCLDDIYTYADAVYVIIIIESLSEYHHWVSFTIALLTIFIFITPLRFSIVYLLLIPITSMMVTLLRHYAIFMPSAITHYAFAIDIFFISLRHYAIIFLHIIIFHAIYCLDAAYAAIAIITHYYYAMLISTLRCRHIAAAIIFTPASFLSLLMPLTLIFSHAAAMLCAPPFSPLLMHDTMPHYYHYDYYALFTIIYIFRHYCRHYWLLMPTLRLLFRRFTLDYFRRHISLRHLRLFLFRHCRWWYYCRWCFELRHFATSIFDIYAIDCWLLRRYLLFHYWWRHYAMPLHFAICRLPPRWCRLRWLLFIITPYYFLLSPLFFVYYLYFHCYYHLIYCFADAFAMLSALRHLAIVYYYYHDVIIVIDYAAAITPHYYAFIIDCRHITRCRCFRHAAFITIAIIIIVVATPAATLRYWCH